MSVLPALLVVFGIMALILAGCSGGHGPTVPSPDGPGDGPDDGPDDGPGDQPDDGELTTAETVAAVEEYGDAYVATLNEGATIPEALAEVAAMMEASGDFSAVEIDGTGLIVWAEFINGWPYAIIGNRVPGAEEVADERADAVFDPTGLIGPAAAEELPDSTSAVVMSGFGIYRPDVTASNGLIAQMLSARGYQATQRPVTVANLTGIGNPGVVMINSHAAAPDDTSIGRPALWLDEPITQARADQFKAMGWKDNDYITLLSTGEDDPNTGESVTVNRFAATDLFIAGEVSLGSNSVVFSQSCNSGAAQMVQAWLAAGAGIYAGWSDWCAGSGTPKFFFDRMTAADEYMPESPDQRPFDWQFVLTDMRNRGLDTTTIDPGLFGGLAGGVLDRTATLNIYTNNDTGILAPTIRYLEMDEPNDQLIIHGVFGSDEGEVTVAGVTLGIAGWEPTEIRCDIPRDGVGSEGAVKVTVDGRDSNQATLTSWRPHVDYTFQGKGSIKVEFDMDFHFRGDVREWRREPGAQPMFTDPYRFEAAQDSEGTWDASGEYTQTNASGTTATVRFRGSGDLQWLPAPAVAVNSPASAPSLPAQAGPPSAPLPGFSDPGLLAFGQIRPQERQMRVALRARADVTVESLEDGNLISTTQAPVEIPFYFPDYADGFFPNQIPYQQLRFGSRFSLGSDRWQFAAGDAARVDLDWRTTNSSSPPDEQHER